MKQENPVELKLFIELVPKTSWYSNLRSNISDAEWDKLRKQVYAKYQFKCGICGSEGRLNCHEIWEYDDKNRSQKLVGFIALCDMCHHVKHIGLAGVMANDGRLDFDKVIEHFMKVNNCDRATFDSHYKEAFATWNKRSRYQWQIDLGEYQTIIKNKQQ